jgi:hypothetical protein
MDDEVSKAGRSPVTPGQTAFLLLHPKQKNVKPFFQQVHLLYGQLLTNSFYDARRSTIA